MPVTQVPARRAGGIEGSNSSQRERLPGKPDAAQQIKKARVGVVAKVLLHLCEMVNRVGVEVTGRPASPRPVCDLQPVVRTISVAQSQVELRHITRCVEPPGLVGRFCLPCGTVALPRRIPTPAYAR